MKKIIKQNFVAFLVILAVIKFGCPIYKIFNVMCPFCGTTRAWISAIKLDFAAAFTYNVFFIVLPFYFIALLNYDFLSQKIKKVVNIFLYFFGIIFFIFNLYRVIPF